jgi:hypothetical protein
MRNQAPPLTVHYTKHHCKTLDGTSDYCVAVDLNAAALGKMRNTNHVIPAKAGIHTMAPYGKVLWFPAFAGMTVVVYYPHESQLEQMDLRRTK